MNEEEVIHAAMGMVDCMVIMNVNQGQGGALVGIIKNVDQSNGEILLSSGMAVTIVSAKDVTSIRVSMGSPLTGNGAKVPPKDSTRMGIRRHLADRHGMSVKYVNGQTPDQLVIIHDGIDHGDLHHHH